MQLLCHWLFPFRGAMHLCNVLPVLWPFDKVPSCELVSSCMWVLTVGLTLCDWQHMSDWCSTLSSTLLYTSATTCWVLSCNHFRPEDGLSFLFCDSYAHYPHFHKREISKEKKRNVDSIDSQATLCLVTCAAHLSTDKFNLCFNSKGQHLLLSSLTPPVRLYVSHRTQLSVCERYAVISAIYRKACKWTRHNSWKCWASWDLQPLV